MSDEEKAGNARLSSMLKHMADADELTDGELIDAVFDEIQAYQPMTSREGQILFELLDRFQRLAGVEETPKGITIDGEPVWPDVIGENEPKGGNNS